MIKEMKPLSLPHRFTIKNITSTSFTFSTDDISEINRFRGRAQGVLQACLDIEEHLKEMISRLLFFNLKDKAFLTSLLLENSSCTFGTKRKILKTSLTNFKVISNKEIQALDLLLSKTMKYRNAFAHGKIGMKSSNFYLEYFEGEKQKKELNEEFWDKLSENINGASNKLDMLEVSIAKKLQELK